MGPTVTSAAATLTAAGTVRETRKLVRQDSLPWSLFVFLFALSCLGNVYPVAIFTVVLLGLIFLVRMASGARLHKLGWLMLCLFAYSVFSAWVAGITLPNFLEYDFWRYDAKFIFSYLPFLAALVLRHSERHLRLVSFVWIVGSALVVLLALWEFHYYPEASLLPERRLIRITSWGMPVFEGLFLSHTATGGLYALALIASVSLSRGAANRWPYYVLAVLLGVGLVLTLSRAFAVATMLALFLQTTFERRWRFIAGSVVVVMLLLATIGTNLLDRLTLAGRDPTAALNVQVRLSSWRRGWEYFRISPLLGIGFTRFDDSPDVFVGMKGFVAVKHPTGTLQVADVFGVEERAMAHNAYLQLLAETGILGLGLWLVFWAGVLSRLYHRRQAMPSGSFLHGWLSFCLTGSTAVLLASFFGLNFLSPATMVPLGWSLGAALSPYGIVGRTTYPGRGARLSRARKTRARLEPAVVS